MAKHTLSKTEKDKYIIENKALTYDLRHWTVGGVAESEKTVYVDFGRQVPYQVVKLSLKELPHTDTDGKKVTWINNFGVKGPSGKYAERVKYTLFLPELRGKTFVYYQHGALRHDKKPKRPRTKPPKAGYLQVDFYTGDPGTGYK